MKGSCIKNGDDVGVGGLGEIVELDNLTIAPVIVESVVVRQIAV